ncbi:MAG: hypothetical protein ACKOA8_01025, partial [Deltaproteobacteria bacterium]
LFRVRERSMRHLAISFVWFVFFEVSVARAVSPEDSSSSLTPGESVSRLVDNLIKDSKKNSSNHYFKVLTSRICSDLIEPVLYRLEESNEKSLSSPSAIFPHEILVVSVIPHNKEFPGLNADFELTKHGIPAITLAGSTPKELEDFLKPLAQKKPGFKKIFITFSSHGLAIYGNKEGSQEHSPPRRLSLGIPSPEKRQIVPNTLNSKDLGQWGQIRAAKFEDYLAGISNAFPEGGRIIQVTVDSCMSGAGLEDWLRLQQKFPNRKTNFGITLTTLGNESEVVDTISPFERVLQDAFIRGGNMDSDQSGVITADEFNEFASRYCQRKGQTVHSNPYAQIPVLKTGGEKAIAAHQSLNQNEVYRGAVRLVQSCLKKTQSAPDFKHQPPVPRGTHQ